MKILFRYRRLAATIAIGLIAATGIASAAEAGGRYRGGSSRSWNGGYRQENPGYRQSGGGNWGGYRQSAGNWGGGQQCSDHPAHRFFDGRMYCSGKNADGSWRGSQRCEDECGHKLVNDPGWVQAHRYGNADECRDDDRRWGRGEDRNHW